MDSALQVNNYNPWGNIQDIQHNLTYEDTKTGLRYDFNYGFECATPKVDVVWSLRIWNDDTGDLLIQQMVPSNSYFSTPIKYYLKWRVEISSKIGTFKHTLNLKYKQVAFKMAHRTLGDCIAYLSQIPYFVNKHHCKPVLFVQPWFKTLFEKAYPTYTFELLDNASSYHFYATYYLGLIHDPSQSKYWEKVSFKQKGLQHQAAHILGLDDTYEPMPPDVVVTKKFKAKRPYVCISYSGSKACKMWNNPVGWRSVIHHLHTIGYDVYCIDRDFTVGMPGSWYSRPEGCIDLIGDIPLQERVNVLVGADFFIGMASGLSWLAWCCRIPVIMISGFSRPSAEFYTPYRVYNEEAPCIDCWGDESIIFNAHDFCWCPRFDAKIDKVTNELNACTDDYEKMGLYKKREELRHRKFGCTFLITAERVNRMIDKLIDDKKKGLV